MHPLNNGSQVEKLPPLKPRSGTPGYFSESNDNGAPSYPGQDWFNAVIREFQNALAARGVAFDPDKFDHLKLLIEGAGDPTGVNSLQYRVGHRIEIHSATIPDWLLKADGSIVSRTVDDVLWSHAENSGLLISQALKDGDPVQYAMYYGDGDGSTTFSLPNWYLGHFPRGNPTGVNFGQTQDSQNLEHDHICYVSGAEIVAGGSIGTARYAAGGRTTKQGGSEARPKTGNINICIERGKIPA